MDAVKNRDDLLSIKEEYLRRQKSYRRQVLVCGGAGCISSNCGEVRDALIKSVSTYKLDDEVKGETLPHPARRVLTGTVPWRRILLCLRR